MSPQALAADAPDSLHHEIVQGGAAQTKSDFGAEQGGRIGWIAAVLGKHRVQHVHEDARSDLLGGRDVDTGRGRLEVPGAHRNRAKSSCCPVRENLDLPLSYRNIKPAERQALVADVLDKFQIVGKKDLFPNQLSGGQQQLVAVARAVIGNPKLILADEPTGNLHSSQAEEIMELFKKLNAQGTTIIQVTHSEKNAAFGDRIINLLDGRIATD